MVRNINISMMFPNMNSHIICPDSRGCFGTPLTLNEGLLEKDSAAVA